MQKLVRQKLCSTCLSLNRKLRPLASFPGYMKYCFGLGLKPHDIICWECSSSLAKYKRFREKAILAHHAIEQINSVVFSKQYLEQAKTKKIFCEIKKLSSLTEVKRNAYTTVYSTACSNEVEREQVFVCSSNDQNELNDEDNVDIKVEVDSEGEDVKDENMVSMDCEVEPEKLYAPPTEPIVPVQESVVNEKKTLIPKQSAPKKVVRRKRNKRYAWSKKKVGKKKYVPVEVDEEALVTSLEQTNGAKLGARRDSDTSGTDTAPETESLISASVQQRQAVERENDDILTRFMNHRQMVEFLMERRNEVAFSQKGYKCMKCAKLFSRHRTYRRHMLCHTVSAGRHKCQVCAQRFREEAALKEHVAEHYRYFECRLCGFREQELKMAVSHWREKHLGITCSRCGAEFRCVKEFNKHSRIHFKKKELTAKTCQECGDTYYHNSHLLTHMHRECPVCKKKVKGGDAKLRYHMKIHANYPTGVYCVPCNKHYSTPETYRAHLKSKSHVSEDELRFECDHCGYRCIDKTTLQKHIEGVHLRLKNYTCPQCDMRFHTAGSRARHARISHGSRRYYVCQICGKQFLYKKTLGEHLNYHAGVRPLRCPQCPATFIYTSALYMHRRLVHKKRKRAAKKPPKGSKET